MATERLSMRQIREILRQKLVLKQSHRQVARSLQVSLGTVSGTVSRAQALGLNWDQVEALSDEVLENKLYGQPVSPGTLRPQPDWRQISIERRKPGVTLEILHLEYLEKNPDGYKYSQFCELYRQWLKSRGLVMRQEHRAGDKMFVDYSGKKPFFLDKQTGERIEVELFVAVLGASNYTYAEATRSQQGPEFIRSHVQALQYFGGVPQLIVPDQLRSAVTRPCRYEPGLQRTYQEMAQHYGTALSPARPAHPRDKAKVEVGVQIAQRWILARLRHQTFFGLEPLNERIWELLEELNQRPMRVYRASRRQLFEQLDQPALRPLPAQPFVYAEWKLARVNIDYHVDYQGHYYSVPHTLVGQQVEVRATSVTIEVLHRGHRVASHLRSLERGRHTTVAEHMPKAHQQHIKWTPSRLIQWASTVGPSTARLVETILEERPHPEQGYRSCLGILRLGKRYGEPRLEAACQRALVSGARSYRHVESILKNGMDRLQSPESPDDPPPGSPPHDNIRGRSYYH